MTNTNNYSGSPKDLQEADIDVGEVTRQDPILQQEVRHYNNFDIYEYLVLNENHDKQFGLQEFIVKTKAYYLIKFDQVYGWLTIYSDHLVFEPDLDSEEN